MYVTDEIEILVRKSKSFDSTVVTTIKSGTPVEVLEESKPDGFTRIQTFDNKQGWVESRLLISEPTGRDQFGILKKEYDKLKGKLEQKVQERVTDLTAELDQVKKGAQRPIELQKENAALKQTLEKERASHQTIIHENEQFKSIHKDRQWFLMGAGVAIGGVILGLIITKIPWRRRKRWGEL